jgi:hypothetical protein
VNKQPTRMEQLGSLMTAMIAVIVGGSSGFMVEPEPIYSTHPELAGVDLKEFQRGGRYFGVYARVAKKLGTSRPLVTYTARGKGTRRVLDAILSEMLLVDHAVPTSRPVPLTIDELSHFRNGKYRGVFTRVARSLNMEHSNVWRVGHGEQSQRVLMAIRAEMARVDAELAAKSEGK